MRRRRTAALFAISGLALVGVFGGAAAADDQKIFAYGKHLSQECTTCHKLDGTSSGIPSIVGKPVEEITAALKAFQSGARANPAMVSVAQSLDEDQVRALAVYFASLKKPDRPANN